MRVNLDRLAFRLPAGIACSWNAARGSRAASMSIPRCCRFAEINGQVTVGDERHDSSVEDLRRGLALSGTTVTYPPPMERDGGPRADEKRLGHRRPQRFGFPHAHRTDAHPTGHQHQPLAVAHRRRLGLGRRRTRSSSFNPNSISSASGYSRITTLARYQDKSWLFAVGIQLQPIFSLVGGRPFVIPHSRLTPSSGGVKGVVFLDQNGNGQRDAREPGVKGIDVVADGGRRATSGTHGEFVLGGASLKRRMRVQLDGRTLSADYTATNGAQWANIEPGTLTPVTLGIVVPGSIAGFVRGPDPRDSTQDYRSQRRARRGARCLRRHQGRVGFLYGRVILRGRTASRRLHRGGRRRHACRPDIRRSPPRRSSRSAPATGAT